MKVSNFFAAAVAVTTAMVAGIVRSATLEGAGDLLVSVDASAVSGVANGAFVNAIPNAGTLGGTFVPLSGKSGVSYSADVSGSPAFTFANADNIMTNTVLPAACMLGANPWSVEAWVFNPSFTVNIETYFSWTPRDGLSDNARTVMECRYCDSDGNAIEHWTTNLGWGGKAAVAGSWHYIVATRDANGNERFYLDGFLRHEQNIALRLRNDGVMALGGVYFMTSSSKYWGNAFSGSLAKLRVHSGTLTAAQVANNYSAEVGTLINRWKGEGEALAWNDAANWTRGVLPGDALIDNGGTALHTSGTTVLNSLLVPNGGIDMRGGKIIINRARQFINFAQGEGAMSTISLTGGEIYQSGTNDTHIYFSRNMGVGNVIIGGGEAPAVLMSDRDIYAAYVGGTSAVTVAENGYIAPSNGWFYISQSVGSKSTVTMNGGVVGAISGAASDRRVLIGNSGGDGELIMNSGTLYAKTALNFSYATGDTTSRSVFRMNGGDAYIGKFEVGVPATEGRAYFNGGVIHAVSTQSAYMKNLDSAVVMAGGITFDVPAGVTITIDQALLEDAQSAGGVLHKMGAGRLVLAGANTLSTELDLQEGEVLFSNAAALASFPSIAAADGTVLGGTWEGGPAAVLAKLSANANVALVLNSANANDAVNFTGRPGMSLKTEGTFSYTGTFTPADASNVEFDIGNGTMTYSKTLTDNGATPTKLTVRGTAGGKFIVSAAQSFTGGLVADGVMVQFNAAGNIPASGAITLLNHARLDFMAYQDVGSIVSRLTPGSDGLLIMHDPAAITANLDMSNLPNVVLGTTTNITYSGTITPGNCEYRFGGGNTTHAGPNTGITFSNLADVGGPTRVVIGDPGIIRLAAGNTYSGGTIVTNKGILYLAGADALGALPAEEDPENLFIDNGIIRGGNGDVTIPKTRGITIGAGGATFHQWSTPAFNVLGNLHGAGDVTMSDTGWVTFAGEANDYTGKLVVNSGANTRIGNGSTFSWDADTGVTINGRLAINYNNNLTLGQIFTGSGVLRKEGTGTLTLTSAQSYATTQIDNGTLRVADANVLPSGSGRGLMEILNLGTFDTEGKELTVGALKGVGNIVNSAGGADTLRISASNVNGDFSGTIDDKITVEKTGTNTQTFTANNATSAHVPALVLREGTVELNKMQCVDNLTLAGGKLRLKNGSAGLTGRYYMSNSTVLNTAATMLSSLDAMADFEAHTSATLTQSSTTMGTEFDSAQNASKFPSEYQYADNYIIIWRGLIDIPVAGSWGFALNSDDGSVLYIDGEKLVDNLKDQSYADSQRTGTRRFKELSKGQHDIVIGYYEKTGNNALTAYVMRPGATEDEKLPASMLFSAAKNGENEIASITTTSGVIEFASDSIPVLKLTQNGDFSLNATVKGDNTAAVLKKTGNGKMTISGLESDFDGVLSVENGSVCLDGSSRAGVASIASGAQLTVAQANEDGVARKGLKAFYFDSITSFDYANMQNYAQMESFFAGLTPKLVTTSLGAGDTLDFGEAGNRFAIGASPNNFLLYLTGLIYISETGNWQFAVDSDDGSAVWVDGKSVVARAYDTGKTGGWGSTGAVVRLTRGLHEIRVAYREATGDQSLRVAMKGPSDANYAYIPQANLFHNGNAMSGLAGEEGASVDISNAMLVLVQEVDTEYAGALCGAAGSCLAKNGAGTLTLSGDMSGFAGTLQADEGTVCFTNGGVVQIAKLVGHGRIVIDGGTEVVVTASDFVGDVEVTDGVFTVVATGSTYLSGFVGTISGETLGVTGSGRLFFNMEEGKLNARKVRLGGGASGCVSAEGQLGGADVELDGGTLQLQKTVTPGDTVLADMSDSSLWQFNGDACVQTVNSKTVYHLVDCADTHVGTAFLKTKVNVSQAWYAQFTYNVSTNGINAPADGFSFMIQNEGPTAKGGTGGCTGGAVYETAEKKVIKTSVAVAEAIYNSARCGIFKDGSALPDSGFNAMTGFDRTKNVNYEIYYDGTRLYVEARQGDAVYTRSVDVDLAAVFGAEGAYVGFTASTGGSMAGMGITEFSLRTAGEASGDFSGTDVSVTDGAEGTISTQFDTVELSAIEFGEDSSLTVKTGAGVPLNEAYAVEAETLVTADDSQLTIMPNGTGTGTIAIDVLDCRAGGMLKVVGGSLTARNGMLTIIVPMPIERGVVQKLVNLTESRWNGPLAVTLVDASGNPVKARAFVSGGCIKLSTADNTILLIR